MESESVKEHMSDYDTGSDEEIERILSKADTEIVHDGEDDVHLHVSRVSGISGRREDDIQQENLSFTSPENGHCSEGDDPYFTPPDRKLGCCACCFCGKSRKHKNHEVYPKSSTHSKTLNKKPPNRSKSQNRRGKRCMKCCKQFVAFLFSHIGMCSLVVAYSILGGFIFKELEAPYEKTARANVAAHRKVQVDRLWNITYLYNVLHTANWSIAADEILRDFQTLIYKATKEEGWDGKDGEGEVQWSFAGALLYSITVITTIGYGHIAPKTAHGRMVTVVYALFGIPLTLLCLANMGSFLANCFRFLYKHVCLAVIWLCCPSQAKWQRQSDSRIKSSTKEEADLIRSSRKGELHDDVTIVIGDKTPKANKESEKVRVPILVSLMLIAAYIFGGATLFAMWEGWDYLVGSYFCFITLSTVGFGDFVPGAGLYSFSNQQKLIICAFYLIFGLSLIAMCFELMQEEVRAKFRWLGTKCGIIDDDRK
ncbi:TWiK family of potassium channels protein 18-like [Ylistrum balloti]|uniref:TWiK family of potassium channels protein 18-like n=1 Tax=Ylistrum balloti TaxID=509963 RepID=UPI002905C4F8|nr:TWiK family of potassium channels protein 18-like [Ylistrum balloti]